MFRLKTYFERLLKTSKSTIVHSPFFFFIFLLGHMLFQFPFFFFLWAASTSLWFNQALSHETIAWQLNLNQFLLFACILLVLCYTRLIVALNQCIGSCLISLFFLVCFLLFFPFIYKRKNKQTNKRKNSSKRKMKIKF